MKKINTWLTVVLFFLLLSSCGNDTAYKEEVNQEESEPKKILNDSMREAEKATKDPVNFFQPDLSDGVVECGRLATKLFFHLFP
jgi:PBP1b-binding outer membrane lipoprotein LpoB